MKPVREKVGEQAEHWPDKRPETARDRMRVRGKGRTKANKEREEQWTLFCDDIPLASTQK